MDAKIITKIIIDNCDFELTEKDSFYKTYETADLFIIIRLSNHKSYCQNWLDREKNRFIGKNIKRISIVIEDENTVGNNSIDEVVKHPIEIEEFVYKNYETKLELFEVHRISKAIKNISKNGVYENPIPNKCEKTIVTSVS